MHLSELVTCQDVSEGGSGQNERCIVAKISIITMSIVMNANFIQPNMYSNSPKYCEDVFSIGEGIRQNYVSVLTFTGNILIINTSSRKREIQTTGSTFCPTFQAKYVFPSLYSNLTVCDTATSSSAARTA